MSTKICSNCGWEYPASQPGRRCIICGQPFDIITCRDCGKQISASGAYASRSLCKECFDKRYREVRYKANNAYYHRTNAKLDERFDEWLAKIKLIPKDYPTLTEEQWLEACRFFDGCARCHDDSIDARGFFIAASLGGRYCDWNIIPLCEKCAANWDLTKSVFKYTLKRSQNAHDYGYREYLERIVEYLGGKLDAAARIDSAPAQTTGHVSSSEHLPSSDES